MNKEKRCINCRFVKNMQGLVKGLKCYNENSDTFGEYVEPNGSCKKFERWEEIKPVQKETETLSDRILKSIRHYEERLEQEADNIDCLSLEYQHEIGRVNGRMEIIRDIIGDLKHDLDMEGK